MQSSLSWSLSTPVSSLYITKLCSPGFWCYQELTAQLYQAIFSLITELDTLKKLLCSYTSNTVVICNLAAGCPDVPLCGGQAKDPYLISSHTIDLQLQLTIKAWKSTDPAPHSIHVEIIPVQSLFFEMHHPPCPIHSHHIYFPLSRTLAPHLLPFYLESRNDNHCLLLLLLLLLPFTNSDTTSILAFSCPAFPWFHMMTWAHRILCNNGYKGGASGLCQVQDVYLETYPEGISTVPARSILLEDTVSNWHHDHHILPESPLLLEDSKIHFFNMLAGRLLQTCLLCSSNC